jgi:hypothetical protein
MKELITEEGANTVVLLLSIAVTLGGLIFGIYQSKRGEKEKSKFFWAQSVLCALVGPAIWVYWGVYNSIENYYGLDSLKALKYNFFIVLGISLLFCVLFSVVPKWVERFPASRRR